MAITLNNINFARVSKLGTGTSIPFVRKSGMSESAMSTIISQSSDSATIADALGVINALEIDWNGATLDSTVINTTGDLLNYIKAKSNLTLGTTSSTAAAGNHTHSNYLTKVLKLEKKGTSTIDLLANTTYTLTVGDQTLAFKTPTDQTGGGGTTVTDGSNILTWGSNVTLATVGGVAIDAKLPTNPVTNNAIANLGFTKNAGTVTKVKVGSTEYSPSNGVVSLPAYTTYSQGTNISINSGTISHTTPSGAASGKKGNKTTALLASVTTDSQGHITSYELITVAELKELIGITDPVTTISLNATANDSQIVYNGQTTLTASLSNGASASGTKWNIESGSSYASLSSTTGATITLTGTNTATGSITNNPGTITSNAPTASSISYNGNTTVKVSATAGSVVTDAGTAHDVKVRATNTSATSGYQTKDVTITVNGKSGSSTSSAVSSYKWEFTAGSDYATLQNDTSATVKVVGKNSSSFDQTVIVRCKVTWANGKSAYSAAKSITVQKQNQGNTWYKGTATETQIQTQSYINGLTYNQATKPANNSTLTLSSGYNVFIFPSTWGTPTFGGNSDYSKVYAPYTASDLEITNPSSKAVYVVYSASNNVTAYIKF